MISNGNTMGSAPIRESVSSYSKYLPFSYQRLSPVIAEWTWSKYQDSRDFRILQEIEKICTLN